MATTSIRSMSDTWNNGATTFSAIQMDVTDTASAAGSKLIDLQVGSSEIFEVRKDGQTIITSADAAALAVGPNGATNPVLTVDGATASAATGLEVTGKAAASGVALVATSSGTNESLDIDAKGSGTIDLAGTSTGAVTVGSLLTVDSANANALAVGPNGTTNPCLQVDGSTASAATGIAVTGKAAASGAALAVISSGTNEALNIDAKGSGGIVLAATSTGGITLTTAVAASSTLAVTGASTLTGAVTLGAGLIGSVQDLEGAGAVNVTTLTTKWTTTDADAGTLADGSEGQIKKIVMVSDGGDGTLTPTNFGNGSTITFADAGDAVVLQFMDANWWVVSNYGCTIA